MWSSNVCPLLFLFTGLQCAQPQQEQSHDISWDYLLFTQHWPPTVCVDWMEKNPSHSCSMPKTPDSWTIHGIWPTKIGHIGPQFCNKTWLFDPEEIRPIEAPLEQYWRNLESGTALYDLWAHEWNKHGTCAAAIEPFNSQIKYFSKGLEWLGLYSMSTILEESNIVPSDDKTYELEDFYKAVKSKLNVEPQIQCRSEKGGKQYLFEIRLCYTSDLKLVDCSVVYHFDINATTNCMPTLGITYPASYFPPNRLLVQLYKFSTFLQWFTL